MQFETRFENRQIETTQGMFTIWRHSRGVEVWPEQPTEMGIPVTTHCADQKSPHKRGDTHSCRFLSQDHYAYTHHIQAEEVPQVESERMELVEDGGQ